MALDKDGYPDDASLAEIKAYDLVTRPLSGLIGLVHDNWQYADGPNWQGFMFHGRTLWLHTGGWSGNESVIEALSGNFIFWSLYWDLSRKGGHYRFDGLPAGTWRPKAVAVAR